MIALLRGRVLDKQPNRIILDVSGVGYDVQIPLSTFYEVGEEGTEVSLRIYTHVREDALQLYGFISDVERQVFERLTGIPGIGKKTAERIVLELKDRLTQLAAPAVVGPAAPSAGDRLRIDLL